MIFIRLWCDTVYDNAIAKTAGIANADAVNTNQADITISKKDAQYIYGFLVNYTTVKPTDAENVPDLHVQYSSKSLGASDEEFTVGYGTGDYDALNMYQGTETQYVPFRPKDNGSDLFNAKINFKAAPSITNTEGLAVAIGVLYGDFAPTPQFNLELFSQQPGFFVGGQYIADAGKAHGTANSGVTGTSITVESGVQMLKGLQGVIHPNGITVDDPIAGIVEHKSKEIDNFDPQIRPLRKFFSACLGTVTDQGVAPVRGNPYTTRFAHDGSQFILKAETTLSVAAGVAPDVFQGVAYDR